MKTCRIFFSFLPVFAAQACGSAVPRGAADSPASGLPTGEMIVVPQGLVGVSFSGIEKAGVKSLSPGKAKELKAKVDEAYKKNYTEEGHEKWFFHGFDKKYLYFFVGRFRMKCEGMLGCMEYVADTLYRVPRSEKTEADLEAKHDVDLWEVGIRGVKGGMTEEEVKAVLGEPQSVEALQYVGSFRYNYSDISVTFLNNEVAFVHEADDSSGGD
jgi:hypothetical protein